MRIVLFVLTIWLWGSAALDGGYAADSSTLLQPSPEVIADGGSSLPPPPPNP